MMLIDKESDHFKPMVVAGVWLIATICMLLKITAEYCGWGFYWEAGFNVLAIIPLAYIFAVHFREVLRKRR